MTVAPLPTILFVWDQFGAYHMDRCEAVGAALTGRARVVGIELASESATYAWETSGVGRHFEKHTLFAGASAEALRKRDVARALVREFLKADVTAIFVTGYERPTHFAAAACARARGKHTVVMIDSKYDDKPRRAWLEAFKTVLMRPYRGGFAAGRRSAAYLRLLGFDKRPVSEGYDSVSLDRIRALAGDKSPPAWPERPFLAVARYVPKKNLAFLLGAYAAYRRLEPGSVRRLTLCGGGPLEQDLRAIAQRLGVSDWIDFTGFVGQSAVAALMRDALCLLLPSTEEQWGLVVNEALAFDLPVLSSPCVGATDLLIGQDNGFLLDPQDEAAWADAMRRTGADRALWNRLSAGSAGRAPLGDVDAFVRGAMVHLAHIDGIAS